MILYDEVIPIQYFSKFGARRSEQDRLFGTEAADRLLPGVSVVMKSQRAYLKLEVTIVACDQRPQVTSPGEGWENGN